MPLGRAVLGTRSGRRPVDGGVAGPLPAAVPILARPNGPLVVHGTLSVTLPDGTVVERPKVASFCRCGHSANKPFCDGSHARVGFVG